MKNFEVRYPVDGTSALQPKFDRLCAEAGTIIEFPGRSVQRGEHARQDARLRVDVRGRALDFEMARSLRCGSARGRAFDRIAPWQAVVAGILFTASAFAVLLGF